MIKITKIHLKNLGQTINFWRTNYRKKKERERERKVKKISVLVKKKIELTI